MSGKSNTPGSTLSLPQGGGALQGIGETFAPDLQTGTGNFSVPIALPPGRNGLQPQLTLQYSTGSGNGPFGLGWALSVPGVSRKTTSGIPRYDDALDTFLISGAEDLVPVPAAISATRYRPRTEGLFAHIDHHRDSENDYWQVASKDGLLSLYGTPRPANAPAGWQDPATVTDPQDASHVFAWRLTQTRDPFGNVIDYVYVRDAVRADGPHRWDQLYLSEIRYVDYGDPNAPQFLAVVRFTYAPRPDPFSQYRSGFEIRTVQRCTRIDVVTNPGVETPVRTFHLTYLDERPTLAAQLPPNGISLLSQIQVEGHDGATSEWMPPLEFGHTAFEPRRRKFIPISGADLPPSSLADPSYELADLLGNGLPDILQMNGNVVRYWRNLGGGRFDLPRPMNEAPAGLQLADPGVQLLDADGDGRIDLLVTTPTISGYFPMSFDGLWDRRRFRRYQEAPSFNLEDPEVRLVDLNGDGVTDALRASTRFDCFFNDPETGWGETRRVARAALDVFPNVDFADPRVKWADLTGDGMQDIALVHGGSVEYWPNLGYGNWGRRVHMANSPRLPYGYDPRRILVGDVDGDGLADIVYVEDRRVTLWINQSGNAWSDPIVIEGTPPVADMDAVRLTDLLGVGTSGVLWSANVTALPRPRMFFLDFTSATKPYLVDTMDNHIGALTRVAYASSTAFYVQDQKALATQWHTPLPFPVQVVARVEAIDQISGGKLTTEYSYHHGYWDGVEREFRGFGRVDHRDSETFPAYQANGLHGGLAFAPVAQTSFSPPTETRTWFHLGPLGDEFGGWYEADFSAEYWPGDAQVLARPGSMTAFLAGLPRRVERDALRALRGQIVRSELYALDGTGLQSRPYTVTEQLRGVREESPPGANEGDRLHIFFPFDLAQRTTQWERGDEPMTGFAFSGDYDAYGQLLAQMSAAVPRGRDYTTTAPAGAPYLATFTTTTYAQRDDATLYCVDRVARSTTGELVNDGSPTVFALASQALGGTATTSVIAQSYVYYDGAAFQGLPLGQLGSFGAAVRTETLILTEDILNQAYRSGAVPLYPPEQPPYLAVNGAPPWTADYPQEFITLLLPLAGYVYHPAGPTQEDAAGFFTATSRQYDFQQAAPATTRGLVVVQRDAMSRDTTITYDAPYQLLPSMVSDPANLSTSVVYDYRVIKPQNVTEPNGNSSSLTFTPLGLVATTSVQGKAGEGDQQAPSIQRQYDFFAFDDHGLPISVRTIRREYHDTQTAVPLPQRDNTIESIEYSDGFGRLVQTRTQAEAEIFGDPVFGTGVLAAAQTAAPADVVGTAAAADAPWVVVSGWQVYDNKGKVVEKYEPFFAAGWDYAPPSAAESGLKVTMYYEPRGLATRTVNPDGSEQRVVYGIPPDLTNPDVFAPTPWETYTYDPNDNAGHTHPAASVSYQDHWNTPASIEVDALGRTIRSVARNAFDPGPNGTNWYVTTSTYDIQSNLLTLTDPLGRLAFQHIYDLAKHALRVESIDAGVRRSVLDAAGNPVEQRDSKGALVLHAVDVLSRPIRLWARDGDGQALTLRARTVYGDGADSGLSFTAAVSLNLLGKPCQQYDEAGLAVFDSYDFKGNVLEKSRQVIGDAQILSPFNPPPANWQIAPYRVDWSTNVPLDPGIYQTSTTYDALNRILMLQYPLDVTGARKTLTPTYNRAGALEHLEVDGAAYVDRIAYNAKGQRSLVVCGNGVMTRYAYDTQTFRLVRLRCEPYTTPAALTYHPAGTALQDFAYGYDLVGNILTLSDRTPASGVPNTVPGTEALDRAFSYDPIYRLVSATGRECDNPPPPAPWDDTIQCTDPTLTRAYSEAYEYDAAGNLIQLAHSTGPTRTFALAPGNNRLQTVTVGANPYAYVYDVNGNIVQETTSRNFEWDHGNHMRVYRTQTAGAEPTVWSQYLYDASGQRVKKLVRKQGGQVEVTVYVDGLFEYQSIHNGGTVSANNTLHVMDDKSRVAVIRAGTPFPGDTTPAIKYHLGDHLGSSSVVLDGAGQFVNREEYTPYGETSFGSFALKRYRFTRKERDEESGLYYHGARYFAAWIARWTNCDPAGMAKGPNLFMYANNNPVIFTDPNGMEPKPLPWYGKIFVGTTEGLAQIGQRAVAAASIALDPKGTADAIYQEVHLRYKLYTAGPIAESGPSAAIHALNDVLNPLASAKRSSDRASLAEMRGDEETYIREKIKEGASLVDAAMMLRTLASAVGSATRAASNHNAEPGAESPKALGPAPAGLSPAEYTSRAIQIKETAVTSVEGRRNSVVAVAPATGPNGESVVLVAGAGEAIGKVGSVLQPGEIEVKVPEGGHAEIEILRLVKDGGYTLTGPIYPSDPFCANCGRFVRAAGAAPPDAMVSGRPAIPLSELSDKDLANMAAMKSIKKDGLQKTHDKVPWKR